MQSLARKPKAPAKSSSRFSQNLFLHSFTPSVNCSSIQPADQDGNLETPRHPVHGQVLSVYLSCSWLPSAGGAFDFKWKQREAPASSSTYRSPTGLSLFLGLQTASSTAPAVSHISASSIKSSSFPSSSPTPVIVCLLDYRHPSRCEVVSHCGLICISLMILMLSIFSWACWPLVYLL